MKTMAQLRRKHQPKRKSAAKRGYDNVRWKRFRDWLVSERIEEAAHKGEHPCLDCAARGERFRLGAVLEVHHIRKVADYPQLRLEQSNCMVLCRSCHSVRTNRGE